MGSPVALSIVLPFRDAATTLDEAIESVLAERGPPFELLAIDDGSTDEGARIVEGWASRDRRVRLIRAAGSGLVSALSTGVAHARAAFIGRMDADDVSLPGRFAAQLLTLDRDPSLAAVGGVVEIFGDEGHALGLRRYVAWQNSVKSAADHARAIFIESPLCHPSVTMRASAITRVGGYRAFAGPEDYDLFLRFDEAGLRLAKIDRPALRWRHHARRATFRDPRYALERVRDVKASHLLRRLRALGRPIVVWGAGPTGKRLVRAMEPHGIVFDRFVDIDPDKLARLARGHVIDSICSLRRGQETVLVAVGARGARDNVRAALDALGWCEGADYLCGA
ncbi:MAG: glycosyltransferase [Polyangiales bacterium]